MNIGRGERRVTTYHHDVCPSVTGAPHIYTSRPPPCTPGDLAHTGISGRGALGKTHRKTSDLHFQ